MYLIEMAKQPYPHGLIARMLIDRIHQLQTLSFLDNEKGAAEDISVALARSVLSPVNSRLHRARKSLRIVSLEIDTKAHHQVLVTYQLDGASETAFLAASIYPETRRTKAKKAQMGVDFSGITPPTRGKRKTKKRRRGKRKTAV